MKQMSCVVYREDKFFVAQCLNVDVSSFGKTRAEAIANLKEAVELYFEGEPADAFTPVSQVEVGQEALKTTRPKTSITISALFTLRQPPQEKPKKSRQTNPLLLCCGAEDV